MVFERQKGYKAKHPAVFQYWVETVETELKYSGGFRLNKKSEGY